MVLKWREDLPTDWTDVSEEPPEPDSDFVIESHGNGVIMLPIQAKMSGRTTGSYIYCARNGVTALGEEMA